MAALFPLLLAGSALAAEPPDPASFELELSDPSGARFLVRVPEPRADTCARVEDESPTAAHSVEICRAADPSPDRFRLVLRRDRFGAARSTQKAAFEVALGVGKRVEIGAFGQGGDRVVVRALRGREAPR